MSQQYSHDANEATRRHRDFLFTEEVRGEVIGGEDHHLYRRYAAHRHSDGARVWGGHPGSEYKTDAEATAALIAHYGSMDRLLSIHPQGLELRCYDQ